MSEFMEKEKKEEAASKKTQNRTGIPAQLKTRMEENTGFSFEDVRVHYNSDKPKRLDALAYTQGNQVYIGPGQERHLPHELGHVVQQKMGIVRANARHHSGAAMNTDASLEHQADEIGRGRKVIQKRSLPEQAVIQRMSVFEGEDSKEMYRYSDGSLNERREKDYECVDRDNQRITVYPKTEMVKRPVIGRYKREGWIILQELKKYFTEKSIKNMTVLQAWDIIKQLDELLKKLQSKSEEETEPADSKAVEEPDLKGVDKPEEETEPAEPKAVEEPDPKGVDKPEEETEPAEPKAVEEPDLKGVDKPEEETEPAEPKAVEEPEKETEPAEPKAVEEPEKETEPAEPKAVEETEKETEPAEPKAVEEPEKETEPAEPKPIKEQILDIFRDKLELAGSWPGDLGAGVSEKIISDLNSIKIQMEAAHDLLLPHKSGENISADSESDEQGMNAESIKYDSLVKTGKYKKVGEIDPYLNYKKMAMYCIAQVATKNGENDVGPHIAITVFGGKIYIATNTAFRAFGDRQAEDISKLADRVKSAMNKINERMIMNLLKNKSGYSVHKACFEGREHDIGERDAQQIFQWIQKIKNYSIVVVDVPEHRKQRTDRSGIHGEMSIVDYLLGAGEDSEVIKTLRERNEKLELIENADNKHRRIISFGGTRIDCAKCHEHFEEIRAKIERNYVVSSLNAGMLYTGTESGTRPRDKRIADTAPEGLSRNVEAVIVHEEEWDGCFKNLSLPLDNIIKSMKEVMDQMKTEKIEIEKPDMDFIKKVLQDAKETKALIDKEKVSKDLKDRWISIGQKIEQIERLLIEMEQMEHPGS